MELRACKAAVEACMADLGFVPGHGDVHYRSCHESFAVATPMVGKRGAGLEILFFVGVAVPRVSSIAMSVWEQRGAFEPNRIAGRPLVSFEPKPKLSYRANSMEEFSAQVAHIRDLLETAALPWIQELARHHDSLAAYVREQDRSRGMDRWVDLVILDWISGSVETAERDLHDFDAALEVHPAPTNAVEESARARLRAAHTRLREMLVTGKVPPAVDARARRFEESIRSKEAARRHG